MKRISSTLLLLSLLNLTAFASDKKGVTNSYSVDSKTSRIVWVGEKVTGEHTGNIQVKNGILSVKNGKLSSADIVVDMTSITCTDIDDQEYNANLVGHLKSPDFFDVSNHETAQFVLNNFEQVKGEDGYIAYGSLTIKGTTKEISFPLSIDIMEGSVTAAGTIVFDRSDFNVKYGSSSFFEGLGDKMIYDEVSLKFEISASL